MNKEVRVRRDFFGGAPAACLGEQLAIVVELVEHEVPGACWYAADVFSRPTSDAFDEAGPTLVGTSSVTQAEARKVDQFESGVFFAVPAHLENPKLRLDPETEEDRQADLCDAKLEVRAFDTSYFVIIVDEEDLLERIVARFGLKAGNE